VMRLVFFVKFMTLSSIQLQHLMKGGNLNGTVRPVNQRGRFPYCRDVILALSN
jgi:hypothetical protein